MLLTKFDLKIISQKVIKGQTLTNHLAKVPSSFPIQNQETLPDDKILAIDKEDKWELYFDISRC